MLKRLLPLICLGLSSPAWALYKVVGPDGRVTYTDRPSASVQAKPLNAAPAKPEGASPLPFELQRVVQQFPVVLFTKSGCSPCDSGRALLKARGIPFSEWTVNTPDDGRQYTRQEGTDTLPSLRVGQQQVKGFQASEWHSYLDAAGYPSNAVLPSHYKGAEPRPLVAPSGTAQPPTPTPAPVAPSEVAPTPTPAGGFRF